MWLSFREERWRPVDTCSYQRHCEQCWRCTTSWMCRLFQRNVYNDKHLTRWFWAWSVCPSTLPPLDNIPVTVIVWMLRGNIIRTALCWIVWHNVHSQQHSYMSSSYRSNRLGLSHWDPYAVRRGGCLELYYYNMVEWFWWDSSLIFDDQLVSFSALTLLVWSSGL